MNPQSPNAREGIARRKLEYDMPRKIEWGTSFPAPRTRSTAGGCDAAVCSLFIEDESDNATVETVSLSSSASDSTTTLWYQQSCSCPSEQNCRCNSSARGEKTLGDTRRVSFDQIHLREYSLTLGDHPACRDGMALTLDWGHQQMDSTSLDCATIAERTGPYQHPRRLTYTERRDRLFTVGSDGKHNVESVIELLQVSWAQPRLLPQPDFEEEEEEDDEDVETVQRVLRQRRKRKELRVRAKPSISPATATSTTAQSVSSTPEEKEQSTRANSTATPPPPPPPPAVFEWHRSRRKELRVRAYKAPAAESIVVWKRGSRDGGGVASTRLSL